jgi:hypothetical protein
MNSFELFWKKRPPKPETAKDCYVAGLRRAAEIASLRVARWGRGLQSWSKTHHARYRIRNLPH